jgi:hypothetical protein
MMKKIPVIGGVLANVVGFAAPAALGAVSVYPTLMAMKYAGGYIPERLQPFGFTIVGTVLAAVGMTVAGKLNLGTPAMRKQVATAMASAGGAVDFYRHIQGQSTIDQMEEAETAGLGYAGGMATGVQPMMARGGGYGALEINMGATHAPNMGALEITGDYSGAGMGDAAFSGGDMSGDEVACALSGPRSWRKRFGRPARSIYRRGGGLKNRAQSNMAAQHGHRWGWLIKIVGFQGMQQIAQLPPQQRQQVIAGLRQQAVASLPALMADHANSDAQVSSDEAAGMGALITMAGW